MYEAFAANLPHTTGIIQWMLNAAWPKLCWQLYDYNLVPGGAFFGAQRGAAPSAVIYNYGNQGIYLVNQSKDTREMRTTVTVYDANSQIILSTNVISRSVVYGSKKIFDLSGLQPATPVYFLDLATRNAKEREVARNFYWLSTKPDVLDEEKSKWFVTPNQSFSDFTGLNRLPEATVKTTLKLEPAGGETRAVVTLTNESDRLAFFIEMRLVDPKSQASLTPVFWEDNYVSLPPHSSKSYSAILPKRAARPELKLRGWNVKFE
jgi:exo-1,4-beta-D-glucosaminidase